jgi:hypothetical protein
VPAGVDRRGLGGLLKASYIAFRLKDYTRVKSEFDMKPCPSLSQTFLIATLFIIVGCNQAADTEGPPDVEGITATLLELENQLHLEVDSLQCELGLVAGVSPTFIANGQVLETSEDLREMCAAIVEPRTGATWDINSRVVNVLSSEAAYVVRSGLYTVSLKDGGSEVLNLAMTSIWQRIGDQWKTVHLHESWY